MKSAKAWNPVRNGASIWNLKSGTEESRARSKCREPRNWGMEETGWLWRWLVLPQQDDDPYYCSLYLIPNYARP